MGKVFAKQAKIYLEKSSSNFFKSLHLLTDSMESQQQQQQQQTCCSSAWFASLSQPQASLQAS